MSELWLIAVGIVLCSLIVMWSLLQDRRIDWVYEQRMKLLDQALDDTLSGKTSSIYDGEYFRLPSFAVMVAKFWVWDVEKFIRPKE